MLFFTFLIKEKSYSKSLVKFWYFEILKCMSCTVRLANNIFGCVGFVTFVGENGSDNTDYHVKWLASDMHIYLNFIKIGRLKFQRCACL